MTLSLAKIADEAIARELLATARRLGINTFDAGTDPAQAKRIRVLAREIFADPAPIENFSLILSSDAKKPEDLARFLEDAGAESGDILAIEPKAALAAEAARARASGRIAAYGFFPESGNSGEAGHTGTIDPADLTAAIDGHPGWDFCALPLNYLVRNLDEAIAHAADREIPVIATDPLAGGMLEAVSPAVHEFFRNAPVPRSHDEWALRAIWERQEVTTVVWNPAETRARNAHGGIAAGAGTTPSAAAMVESLTRKAIYADAGRANSLPSRELAVIRAAADALAGESGTEKLLARGRLS